MNCTVMPIMRFAMELRVKPEKCSCVGVGCYRLKWVVSVLLADLRYRLDYQVLCLRLHLVCVDRFQCASEFI